MTTLVNNDDEVMWLAPLPPAPVARVANERKPKCCSFCKNSQHTIQHCSSIRISLELDKIEIKIESSIMVLVNELARTSRNGTFDANTFSNLIRSFILSWIRRLDKSTLMALCFKIKEQSRPIYGEQYVTTKMKKRELVDILVFYYSAVMTDAINLHNGTLTYTFRSFMAQRLLKFLGEIAITDNAESDARQYYMWIHNYKFYDKKLNNHQLMDILKHMREDAHFSYTYLALGEQKCFRIAIIVNSMEVHMARQNPPPEPFEFAMEQTFLGSGGEEFDCPICLEHYIPNKEVQLSCQHIFCKDCLFTTIETNLKKKIVPPCPLCRTSINKVSIRDESDYHEFMARFEEYV